MTRTGLTMLSAAIAGIAASTAADTQMLANVTGFDARLLAGKICQGVWDTGRKQQVSRGALTLRFGVEGSRLTAQTSCFVGQEVHGRAAYAVTRQQPLDTSGYEPLGAVRSLSAARGVVRYTDPLGARVQLSYSEGGKLSGHSDPRGGSDPRMTRVAVVQMFCSGRERTG
jgi:YD repeat-containing protein